MLQPKSCGESTKGLNSLNSIVSSGASDNDEAEFTRMNDEQAVHLGVNELKLSKQEQIALMDEINCTTDYPVLVVKENPAWIALNGQNIADEIMDHTALPLLRWREDVGVVVVMRLLAGIGGCFTSTLTMISDDAKNTFWMITPEHSLSRPTGLVC